MPKLIRYFAGKEGSLRWLKIIGNARIVKDRVLARAAMAQAAWVCKKGNSALPAFLMAAGSARIAGGWADLIPPAIQPRCILKRHPAKNPRKLDHKDAEIRGIFSVSIRVLTPP